MLKALTIEEMAVKVPALTAQAPADKMSNRYSFLPTSRVVEDIAKLGWSPVAISGVRTHNPSSRHLVRFQPNNELGVALERQNSIPELILINSHNGTSAFKVMAGIFRFACANGLIIAEKTFASIQIRHTNYSVREAVKAIGSFTKQLPAVTDSVLNMERVKLSDAAKKDFASKAYAIREEVPLYALPESEGNYIARRMLTVKRSADRDDSLWTTFNVVQENLVKGNYPFMSRNGMTKARAIKSVPETVRVNTALHELAQSYL